MARIALVWELGADLGHITRYSLIARELIKRGHEPMMILRDTSSLHALAAAPANCPVYQAPVCQQAPAGLMPALNFTETLFRVGFHDPEVLASLMLAWRYLLELLNPDLIVFDHAPVAQLATHALDCDRIIFSNSFSVPPAGFPSYRFWLKEPDAKQRIRNSEQTCLDIANKALASLGSQPVKDLDELFEVDEIVLCEHPDFDVYGHRDAIHYVGAINEESLGDKPNWPGTAGGPKIFAYLKSRFQHIDELLECLANSNSNVIVYLSDVTSAQRQRFENAALSFSEVPLNLTEVAKDCDYAICHGGTGTINTVVAKGIPVLSIPLTVEQMMFSKRVESCGLAHVFPLEGEANLMLPTLKKFLADKNLQAATKAWQEKYALPPMQGRLDSVCDQITQLADA